MIACDFHLHTNFCDGKHTPTEVADQAFAAGIQILGFSEHSYLPFEPLSLHPDQQNTFIAEVTALKDIYRGRMKILCGLEKDYFSPVNEDAFDYVIGSVHYLNIGDAYPAIDEAPETTKNTVQTYFNGDPYAYAEAYFKMVSSLFDRVRADIIGHFDLLMKFHEKQPLLDVNNPRYIRAWQRAVEALIPYEKPFEINSGAISRGWRTVPYPSLDILKFIHKCGGRIILSSDSHHKDTLRYRFDESRELALACGFTKQWIPDGTGKLIEMPL